MAGWRGSAGHDSPFGREFDSLADIVSFGLAPALMVYRIVLEEFRQNGMGRRLRLSALRRAASGAFQLRGRSRNSGLGAG